MYVLNFWCNHGGECIWAKNDSACNTFGHGADYIEYRNLPISDKLISKLKGLDDEYHSYLDWEHPPNHHHGQVNTRLIFLIGPI